MNGSGMGIKLHEQSEWLYLPECHHQAQFQTSPVTSGCAWLYAFTSCKLKLVPQASFIFLCAHV